MGTFGEYLEIKVLDLIWGSTGFVPSTKIYFGLTSATLTSTGEEYSGAEPSTATGYARVYVGNTSANFIGAETSGTVAVKYNSTSITFPTVANSSWPTVNYAFCTNASCSSGYLLCWGALTTPKSLAVGDTASFSSGAFKITLD